MTEAVAKLMSPSLYASGTYQRRWRAAARRGAGIVMMYHRTAAETGGPPLLFAYPDGAPEHRCAFAEETVRRAGCEAAFTTELGVVTPECSRFALPRVGFTRAFAFVCAYQTEMAFRAAAPAAGAS